MNSSTRPGSSKRGNGSRRARFDVHDAESRLDLDDRPLRRIFRSGVDVAVDTRPSERAGERPDVDVHAPAVAGARLRQRRGVHAEHRNPPYGARRLMRCRTWIGDYPRPRSASVDESVSRWQPAASSRSSCLERPVDLEEHLLLALGQRRIAHHGGDEVGGIAPLVEDPGTHVERLGRDAQPACDALQDLGRRLAQPSLDLAEVRVGDAGELAQLPERQPRVATLVADEVAEVVQPRFEELGASPSSSRGSRDATLDEHAVDRVDDEVQLPAQVGELALELAQRRQGLAQLLVGERREIGERRVDDELLAAVGPVQLERRARRPQARRVSSRSSNGSASAPRMFGRSLMSSSTGAPRSRRAASASRISIRACARRR